MLRTSKRGLKAFLKFIIIIFASIRNGFLTCYLVTWYRVSEWLSLTIYVVAEVRTCQYAGCEINLLLAIKSQLGWVILLFNFKGLISCKKGFRVIRASLNNIHSPSASRRDSGSSRLCTYDFTGRKQWRNTPKEKWSFKLIIPYIVLTICLPIG